MANLSIKDVPDGLAETLRQRAARNHRSLQGELMAIIEQAAHETGPTPAAVQAGSRPGSGRAVLRRGTKPIEQIAAEHRAHFPQPIGAGPRTVDIIRAERDAL
ncbi:MAG: Arc family DNA-binding protein [Variovorax sp.]|nr:MAG: Arc family DNA-binding protein [Variovorax sp.]